MIFIDLLSQYVLPVFGLASLLTLWRLIRGPSLADRVVALDLLSTMGIAVMGVQAMITGEGAYLDVGLVLGMVGFLTTVAFAFYMQRGATAPDA